MFFFHGKLTFFILFLVFKFIFFKILVIISGLFQFLFIFNLCKFLFFNFNFFKILIFYIYNFHKFVFVKTKLRKIKKLTELKITKYLTEIKIKIVQTYKK